jgi:hypothetical protein
MELELTMQIISAAAVCASREPAILVYECELSCSDAKTCTCHS